MKAAVIIAAYRAERWIRECLDAWQAVEVPDGWTLDIRIGVDGCEATAKELHRTATPYRYSAENVGTYLIRNSLIGHARADAYVIFDADDMPHADYLAALLPHVEKGRIAGPARRTIDENGKETSGRYPYVNGVCAIPHEAWEKLGGYRSWRVAADHDLIQRARAMRIPVHKHPNPVYTRRVHTNSLTRRKDVGLRSEHRKRLKRESARTISVARRRSESLRIEPETVELHHHAP